MCVCHGMGCASHGMGCVSVLTHIMGCVSVLSCCFLRLSLFLQAFVDFFSRGLQEEYRRQGIIIQVCVLLID